MCKIGIFLKIYCVVYIHTLHSIFSRIPQFYIVWFKTLSNVKTSNTIQTYMCKSEHFIYIQLCFVCQSLNMRWSCYHLGHFCVIFDNMLQNNFIILFCILSFFQSSRLPPFKQLLRRATCSQDNLFTAGLLHRMTLSQSNLFTDQLIISR